MSKTDTKSCTQDMRTIYADRVAWAILYRRQIVSKQDIVTGEEVSRDVLKLDCILNKNCKIPYFLEVLNNSLLKTFQTNPRVYSCKSQLDTLVECSFEENHLTMLRQTPTLVTRMMNDTYDQRSDLMKDIQKSFQEYFQSKHR